MIGIVEGSLLVGGLLFALQSHFKFERTSNGKWTLKVEKKPTSNSLLTPLLKKILSLIG
jgi:hypothetical protein